MSLIILCFTFKNTYINITHGKVINLTIKKFGKKIKPKSQFTNEKQSKFLNLKKKKKSKKEVK